jgi:hypothetical protein
MSKELKKESVTFAIMPSLKEKLREEAERRQRSLSQLILLILQEYIDNNSQKNKNS